MGFLRRRSNLETELAGLHTRRDLLTKQLATTEARLDEALASRRARLLEGDDLDAPHESPVIERLRDERSAVTDALAAIDAKLVDAQRRLAAEQDSCRREAAAKELTAAVDQLDRVAADLAAAIAKIPGVLDDVLNRMPLPHVILKANVESFAASVVEALRAEAGEARRYITRLVEGDAALVTPRPDVRTAAPPPIVERREVFLLAPSRWTEPNGEVLTGGPHATCSPPAAIAARALELGHALEPLSEHALVLRQCASPNYACFSPQDCVDLTEPKSTKSPGSPTATLPLVHSEFNRGRAGFASVLRNAR
jgi:hypothetical protein